MSVVAAAELEGWGAKLLERAGLSSGDAHAVSATLAYAEERGTTSHGFIRLRIYLDRIAAGGINPAHSPKVLWDLGGLVALDADAGPGAATAVHAAELAAERATRLGISGVLVSNANHFGAAAFYAEQLADRGMIGIVTCNTDKAVCAPGGGRAVLGTNPLAIALPVDATERPILDMATSEVAYGKLLLAEARGEQIPLGWAFDAEGRPTTSPTDGLHGAMMPAAGPKGFGLAFMIDALLALGGANTSPHVAVLHGDPASPQGLGQMFIAIDASRNHTVFASAIDDLVEQVHGSGLPGGAEALVPGEPEARRRSAGLGVIQVTPELSATIAQLSQEFGVPELTTDGS